MNLSGQLFMLMICAYLRLNVNGIVRASRIKMYAALGDNVTLSCGQKQNAEGVTLRWRREDGKLLSSGIRHFNGDQEIEQFYLLIIDIKDVDYGTYICDWQTGSDVIEKITHLVPPETTSKNPTTPIEMTTIKIYSTQDITNDTTEPTQGTITTANGRNQDENNADNGSFFRENIYFVTLGAGLIVVLCLSIGCNIFINKKCKSHKMKIQSEPQQGNRNSIEANLEEDNIFGEFQEDLEQYELIDENKMTHYDYPSENDIGTLVATRKGQQRLDEDISSHHPYLTVVDDNSSKCTSSNESIKKQENHKLSGKSDEKKVNICEVHQIKTDKNEPKLSSTRQEGTVNESKLTFSDETEIGLLQPMVKSRKYSDKTGNKTKKRGSYSNPYNPLRTDDMEYLHSYSTPIKMPSNDGQSVNVKRDSYINPYNPIRSYNMDYLKSYSTLKSSNSAGSEDKVMKADSNSIPYVPLQNTIDYVHRYSLPAKQSLERWASDSRLSMVKTEVEDCHNDLNSKKRTSTTI